MSYLSMMKMSCEGNNKTSSKRFIMYHFVFVSIFMVLIQATFTLILIYKWANAPLNIEGNTQQFEIYSVFPDVIWYCVFGCITGLAGINGFGKQEIEQTKEKPIEELP